MGTLARGDTKRSRTARSAAPTRSNSGGKWASGHGDKGLRLENEFLATWEIAGEAIAHEFVAEDAVAFGYTEGHAHEIGESAEL